MSQVQNENKQEEIEEGLLASNFITLSETSTAIPTPIEWNTDYISPLSEVLSPTEEGFEHDEEDDLVVKEAVEVAQTPEIVLQHGLRDLAKITKGLVDHVHYSSSKVIHNIKMSYLDKENNNQDIIFPCQACHLSEERLEINDNMEKLLHAVDQDTHFPSRKYLVASRIVRLEGLDEVWEELLEEVRWTLFPHELHISAKLQHLNIISEESEDAKQTKRANDILQSDESVHHDDQRIGSLVVLLPVAHKGGDVLLRFRSESIQIELDKKFAPVVSRTLLQRGNLECEGNEDEDEDEGYYELIFRTTIVKHPHARATNTQLADQRRRYENRIRCGLAMPRIVFLAYYSEVDEMVETVQFGTRISLLYHIYSEGSQQQHEGDKRNLEQTESSFERALYEEEIARRHLVAYVVDKNHERNLREQTIPKRIISPPLSIVALMKVNLLRTKLLELLQNTNFLADGGDLGFPCFHLYEQESDLPSVGLLAKRDLMGSDLKLRGADALIAIVGAQAGVKLTLWRVMRISDGRDISMEFLQSELPSVLSARDQFGSIRLIQNSFLGQGVDVGEITDWQREGGEHELGKMSIHWVTDRKDMPRNKVMEGFVSSDGVYNSLGTLKTQCVILYTVPPIRTPTRLAIIQSLQHRLLPRSLEHIQAGYERDVENRMSRERYEEFVEKEGVFRQPQLQREATRWNVSSAGNRELGIAKEYFNSSH